MSLLPFIFENFNSRPSGCCERSGFLSPFISPEEMELLRIPSFRYYRPSKSENEQKYIGSGVTTDKEKFQINLDILHFSPEEITVKTSGNNTILVEGKHEERRDEHGFVSRQFVRRYILPEGHNIEKVESKLSSDGVLSITAPKIQEEGLENRTIPISLTGKPSTCVASCTREGNQEELDRKVPAENKTS